MIPVPVPQSAAPAATSRTNVDEKTPERIVVGGSSRTQVLLMLGEPDGRGPNDSWFTYGSVAQRGGIRWADSLQDYGDWDISKRLLVRFGTSDIVSSVEFSQHNCTDARHDCLEPSGDDLLTVDEARVAAAGPVLAHYDNTYLEWWSSHDCNVKHKKTGGPGGFGQKLVVTQTALFWTDRRDAKVAPGRWRMLPFQDIDEVLQPQDNGVFEWIRIRKHSGSCFIFHPYTLADANGLSGAQQLSSLIRAYLPKQDN